MTRRPIPGEEREQKTMTARLAEVLRWLRKAPLETRMAILARARSRSK